MHKIHIRIPPIAAVIFTLLFTSIFSITVSYAEVKQRIISLSPANTELAYAAGMGDSLIAVSAYSDYPPEAKKLEQVADWQGINLERIIALKPDLILAWRGGNPQRPLDQIAALGIPVIYFDPNSINEIIAAINTLAEYSPHPDIAKKSTQLLQQQLDDLHQKYQNNAINKPVFIQLGTQPLFTAGGKTLQNEIVALCGGQNIFANSQIPWPQVSREQVLVRQPEYIIIAGSEDQKSIIERFWQPQMKAKIISLNQDWFHRAGPRSLLAAQQLCAQINPINQ
ncbi:vitamin B12 ABC transporter substrate-binding protein BtuF [Moellerella wisconsensis]|uniref:vitamin B12 ABC transporter substrate-binding protein BtuF n=1 Tax=Moellerella wisconsensis TaxID=158849 RepID=UPI001F4EAECF|nr:vitamin B12 ABC transporter substrate-binding protein BtuF [Moellerella wisconsensis]UNH26684.1 vitamin B12 ABC transporter substrate-binding protein BtuF [Moellerella wisconsensis]